MPKLTTDEYNELCKFLVMLAVENKKIYDIFAKFGFRDPASLVKYLERYSENAS